MAHPMIPVLLSLSLMLASAPSAADNASATASALKILTQPHDDGHEASAAPPPRSTITVERSETLDMLVRRLYAGSPFKDEFLRKALAELNPKVLPNAANSLLKRGSVLTLPTAEDLRRTLVRQYPAAAELVAGNGNASHDGQGQSAVSAPPVHRRWVRYP